MLPVFAAAHGTFDVSDRTEVHWRVTETLTTAPEQSPTTSGFDLYNAALARLQVATTRWDYGLSYSPTLSYSQTFDANQNTDPLFYQYANASVAWHNRFLRFSVTESASYGEYNAALLLQAPVLTATPTTTPIPLQPTAASVTIKSGSSVTDGLATAQIDVYSSLTLGAGYSVSGGITERSRQVLPELYGPHASAVYIRAITRRDSLSTLVSGSDTRTRTTQGSQVLCLGDTGTALTTTCAPHVQIGQAAEALSHRFTPTITLTTSAGVGAVRWRLNPLAAWTNWSAYPVASAVLADAINRRWLVAANVSFAPSVDPRTGLAYELLQGGVTFTDHESRALQLTGGVSVARTWSSDDSTLDTYVVSGDIEAAYLLNRQVDIGVGERVGYQSATQLGGFVSAYTFVGLTVRAPTARF